MELESKVPIPLPTLAEQRAAQPVRKLPISAGTSSGRLNAVALIAVESFWLASLCGMATAITPLLDVSLSLLAALLMVWLGSVMIGFYLLGLYRVVTALPAAEVRRLVLTLSGTAGIITASQLPHLWPNLLALCVLPTVALFACITLPFVRLMSRRYFSRFSWWGRRVLLVGGDARAAAILGKLAAKPHWGLRPVGVLAEEEDLDPSIPNEFCYGPSDKLADVAERLNVSMAVLVPGAGDACSLVDLFHASESSVNTWMVVPATNELPALWTEAYDLTGEAALGWDNHLASLTHRFLKRAFDLILITLLMPILLPLIGVIWLAIKLSSGGDVFFVQERMGRRATKFRCCKFRTMHPNGNEILEAYLAAHPDQREEWNRNFKLKNDPRVTWVGRILRKTSLDELPQLFNVLRGEMSLVGPRPLLESELPRYGTAYASYVQMVPGITGLWQISGRSNTTFDERAEYDEYYVRNWSPWLDIYILGCTIKVVMRCEGAY